MVAGPQHRIGGDRAFYVPAHDYVQVPPPQAYFESINWHRTALHELGHAYYRHRSRLEWVTLATLEMEAEAWKYALTCLNPAHHEACRDFATKCLETYNARCEGDSGEWLSRDEIRRLTR